MGELSAAMLAEVQRADPQLRLVASLELPTETILLGQRPSGVVNASLGYYEPLVESWGQFRVSAQDTRGGLETSDKRLVIYDRDTWLSSLDAAGYRLQGSPVTIKLSSPRVDSGDWFDLYLGEIRNVDPMGDGNVTVYLRPRTSILSSQIPRETYRASDWPTMDSDYLNTPVAQGWGSLFSETGTQTGRVFCPLVDSVGYRHAIGLRYWLGAPRVFKGGSLQTETTDYSITYPLINGRLWTLVDFVLTTGGNDVRVDAMGFDSVGDGSGTLIDDPVDVLDSLCDLIWGASLNPLDATSAAAFKAWLASRAGGATPKASLLLDTQRTGYSLLSEWSQTYQAWLYWKFDGSLAISWSDPHRTDYVASSARLRYPEAFSNRDLPQWTTRSQDLTRSVRVSYGDAEGGSEDTLLVYDPMSGASIDDEMSQAFGPGLAS